MKKVYLIAYLSGNLGDDIFLKIISERYPNTKFIVFMKNNIKYKFNNVKIYNGVFFRGINKILNKISKNKISIPKILAKKYDEAVVLGGSMFIEGVSPRNEELLLAKKVFVLGSNFGPFKEKEYYNFFSELFKKCELVSFREKYSYNLFKNQGDNIQYAPDIVLGLRTNNVKIKNSRKVVFSIIDCKRKIDGSYENLYDKKMIELTKFFIEKKYDIVYMSFCKKEGDEEAIERILSQIEEKERVKISKYFYKNNIEEALNIIADSKIIVGSRFHANILGMVFNKTIIPVVYSDKTSHCLEDFKFKGKIIDIRKLEQCNVKELNDEDLEYKLNISNLIKDSEKHFDKLDKILK